MFRTDEMAEKPKDNVKKNALSLVLKDKAALYASYMPFIKGGALFVPTQEAFELGDEVFVLLTLMEEAEKIQIVGQVVWITPKGAQRGRRNGIGVKIIGDDAETINGKFETILAGSENSDRATDTL